MTHTVLAHTCEGRGPFLLLLHGGVGSGNHWVRNIPALSLHFTVVAVDLPGFGASPDVPKDIEADAYVDLVANTARALCGERVHLCGFSFGAVVAAAMTARSTASVASLSLIAPGGFGNPAGRQLDVRNVSRKDMASEEGLATLRHNLAVTMLADPAVADDATVALHRSNIERTRFDSRRISLTERLAGDLRNITCPLQVIWGEHDRLAHPSIADRIDRIKAVVPTARIDLIPNGGHWIQYECPAQTNDVLLEFMSACADRHADTTHRQKENRK